MTPSLQSGSYRFTPLEIKTGLQQLGIGSNGFLFLYVSNDVSQQALQ